MTEQTYRGHGTMKSIGELLGGAGLVERMSPGGATYEAWKARMAAGGFKDDPYIGSRPTSEQLAANARDVPQQDADLELLGIEFVEFIEWAEHPVGLFVLSGPAGVGKTYAACAAAMHHARLARRNFVAFGSARDLTEGDFSRQDTIGEHLQTWSFAILDDLGYERGSEAATKRVLRPLMGRWDNIAARPMVITTNLSPAALLEGYPEAFTSRMFDVSLSRVVVVEGTDRRLIPRADVDDLDPDAGLWDA